MTTLAAFTLATGVWLSVDVSIDGPGYLRFALEGRIVYAKSATLQVQGGRLTHPTGAPLVPTVPAPAALESLSITEDGWVEGRSQSSESRLGRIVLAQVAGSPTLLEAGLMAFSQRPRVGFPASEGWGKVVSGKVGVSLRTEPAVDPTISPLLTPGSLILRAPERVEVDPGPVRLLDLLQLEGRTEWHRLLESIEIAQAPPVGVSQKISKARVVARVQTAGIAPSQIVDELPPLVEVVTRSQAIPAAQLVTAAREAAKRELGDLPFSSEADERDFIAPVGEVELRAESVRTANSSVSVVLAVYIGGSKFNSRTIRLSVDSAEAGVKAGSTVKVLVRSGGVVAELSGRAKSNAFVGQAVEVSLSLGQPPTQTTHLGVVKAPGIVEVKL